jgi:general secretion pathway protein L
MSFYFALFAQLHAANSEQVTLEAALASVSQEVLGEETTSAARAQELVSQQSGGADDDPMPHVDAFDVMVKLSEDIPQSTTHDIEELDVQKQHATVHGIVGTIPEAQSIKTSLESEKCFKEVSVSRFTKVVGGDRQKYVLDIDLKCPEDSGGKKPKKKEPAAATSGSGGTE